MKINWTPSREKLPDKDGAYLVTIINKDRVYMKVKRFAVDLFEVDNWEFFNLKDKHKPGFYDYDSKYGYGELIGVVAWAECPEGYMPTKEDYEYYHAQEI